MYQRRCKQRRINVDVTLRHIDVDTTSVLTLHVPVRDTLYSLLALVQPRWGWGVRVYF